MRFHIQYRKILVNKIMGYIKVLLVLLGKKIQYKRKIKHRENTVPSLVRICTRNI